MTSDNDFDLNTEKAELRVVQAAIRKAASVDAALTAANMANAADDICTSFGLKRGDVIAGYWPIKTEIDPRPVMLALAKRGMTTALPRTPAPAAALTFHQWRDGDDLVGGLYGTSEPKPDAPICTPTLLLVPMLAFDDDGFRLGYGGGFYDRSLAVLKQSGNRVFALGIAYDSQRVDELPLAPHDVKLDGVLTGSGLFLPQKDT
ncbi:MAG: 5-formyltetrahydrofolate cyclo-ligase [Candidatus Puniceispirillales bacterium WSBS_2018_MAG_OTU23]